MGLRTKHGIHVIIIMAEVVVDEMVMVGGIANLLPLVAVVVDVERGDVACEKRIAMTAAVSARDAVRGGVVRDAVDGRERIARTAALVKDVARKDGVVGIRAKNVILKQR
jgi:hypothetical protein